MAAIDKIRRGNKIYYYVSKNFRIGRNKWKKLRRYAGSTAPSNGDIKRLAGSIESEAISSGIAKPQGAYDYLTEEQAEILEDIKSEYIRIIKKQPPEIRKKYEDDFLVRFTYNSNAIEGNRLTLRDTFLILQEDIMPQDASSYDYNEVINSRKCVAFIKGYNGEFNKTFLLKAHALLTVNTAVKEVGKYRTHNVIIAGSPHTPPDYKEVPALMERLFVWYNNHKRSLHPLELACLIHTRLTRIHPFSDGNGRTARIASNFIIYKSRFPMFFIDVKDRRGYYNSLDESDKGDEKIFVDFIFNRIIEQLKPK